MDEWSSGTQSVPSKGNQPAGRGNLLRVLVSNSVTEVSLSEIAQNSVLEVVAMSYSLWMPPVRRASLVGAAVLLTAAVAGAQSAPVQDQSQAQSSSSAYSSSQAGLQEFGNLALLDSPAASASAGGQYGNGGGYGGKHAFLHSWTFEAGGGFNAPVGNDTPYITWGGNFTLGAGLRFSKMFSTLLEYQFMDNKLPGAFISAVGTQSGDAHFNSITGSPVIDLTPKRSNGVYLVGGFGYYHKSTNFSDYECCDLYGYEVPENVLTITSNQWGGNAGLGIYHRLGGNLYGPDSSGTSEIFAEARYLYVHTPPISQNNGLGTTELIPVTLGVRF